MLYSYNSFPPDELKSHPDKLLAKHLEKVGKFSKEIVESRSIGNKELLSEIAYLIGISHDFGKSTKYFQRWINCKEREKRAFHGFLSSLLTYYLIKRYLDKHGLLEKFWYLPPVAWIVVKKHHGDLYDLKGVYGMTSQLREEDDEVIRDQINSISPKINKIYSKLWKDFEFKEFSNTILQRWKETRKEIYESIENLIRENKLEHYAYVMLFYSVLLDADKLDASGVEKIPERKKVGKILVDNYKKIKFGSTTNKKTDKLREKAYKEVNSFLTKVDISKKRILSITLPTGMGKTLTGFSGALNLRERIEKEMGFTPKIIYSLPFLSIIDQNALVIAEILSQKRIELKKLFKMSDGEKKSFLKKNVPSNLLLKHHHLADITYLEEDNEMCTPKEINQSLILTEDWHSEIVITTFIQFFHSLITNRNRAARKFHNMINSIILLDEVQSIPYKYWRLVKEMLTLLSKEFNCWIILMTATQPLIFEKGEIKELVEKNKKYFESLNRTEYNIDLQEKGFKKFKKELFGEIVKEETKDIMVVLNTINSCKELYEYLKKKLCDKYGVANPKNLLDDDGVCNFPQLKLINLSTHILPDYRLKRIKQIRGDHKRKVVVTTQLVEAGVDIDVDEIYRDFAPLDCIIQTAGRCNREGDDDEKLGIVNIILLRSEDGSGAFCYRIYDPMLLSATKEVFKDISKIGKRVSEKDFNLPAANKYYSLVTERGSKDESWKIINYLKELKFSKISEFKLIEEDLPTMSVFVEICEEAEKTKRWLEKASKMKGFMKRLEFLKLRKQLNSFTLSIRYGKELKVRLNHLDEIAGMKHLKCINRERLSEWYKLDTGFSPFEISSII